MVTIGRVYEKLEKYKQDNYYLRGAEPKKIGSGWERLNLQDVEVTADIYRSLSAARDPSTGEELVTAAATKHRQGYDIAFSPHKSLTVAAFSDNGLREKIERIHNNAVRDAIEYLESELAQCRQGTGEQGKAEPVKTGNILALKVDHSVNREGDPQMHTHIVIFNLTHNEQTQKWQALHSDAFKSQILQEVYENQLAYYMQREGLAVGWGKSDSGRSMYAVLRGVDTKIIDAFSERAKQVDNYLQEHKEELQKLYPHASEGELKQIACLATRKDKESYTHEQLQQRIDEKLDTLKITKQDIAHGIYSEQQKQIKSYMSEYEVVKQAMRSLTDYESAFTRQDLIKASLQISKGDVSFDKINRAIDDYLNDKELVVLADSYSIQQGKRSYSDTIYTTRSMLQAEKNAERLVTEGKGAVQAIATTDEVKNALSAYEKQHNIAMTESQKKAAEHVLTSEDRYNVVQGYAGTGKTTSLKAIKQIAETRGYRVIGISETNAAVAEMRSAGIEQAMTTTKFLHSSKTHQSLDEKTLVIVDESSFCGAKNFYKIQRIAEAHNARVSYWGDKEQLPAISAGLPFRDLQERGKISVVEMTDIVRQEDPALKEAVRDIINHDIDSAFSKLQIIETKQEDAMREVLDVYTQQDGYKNCIISTRTNNDRERLNQLIRDELKQQGVLDTQSAKVITTYQPKNLSDMERFDVHNYNAGDRLFVQKAGAGVKVGAELTIQNVDYENHTVTVSYQNRKGEEVIKTIDVRRSGDRFNVFEKRDIEIAAGEKIIFTKNEKETAINNSDVAYVKNINSDYSLTIEKDGKTFRTDSKYFCHGYASTTYRSQGKTSQSSIYYAPTASGSTERYQDFYVALTRQRQNAIIITDDKQKLAEQCKQIAQKENIVKYEEYIEAQIKKLEKDIESVHMKQDVKQNVERNMEHVKQDMKHDIKRDEKHDETYKAKFEKLQALKDIQQRLKVAERMPERDSWADEYLRDKKDRTAGVQKFSYDKSNWDQFKDQVRAELGISGADKINLAEWKKKNFLGKQDGKGWVSYSSQNGLEKGEVRVRGNETTIKTKSIFGDRESKIIMHDSILTDKVKGVSVSRDNDAILIQKLKGYRYKDRVIKEHADVVKIDKKEFTENIKQRIKLAEERGDYETVRHLQKAEKELNKLDKKLDYKHYQKLEQHMQHAREREREREVSYAYSR